MGWEGLQEEGKKEGRERTSWEMGVFFVPLS